MFFVFMLCNTRGRECILPDLIIPFLHVVFRSSFCYEHLYHVGGTRYSELRICKATIKATKHLMLDRSTGISSYRETENSFVLPAP